MSFATDDVSAKMRGYVSGGDLSRRRPVSVAPVRDSIRVGGRQTCDDDPPFFTPPPAPRASRPSPR